MFIPSILSILSNRLHEFAKPSDTITKNKTKQKKEQISESWGFLVITFLVQCGPMRFKNIRILIRVERALGCIQRLY